MKILWLCGVPFELEKNALDGRRVGAAAAWSWIMGHLPPPDGVELHIACPAKNIKEPLDIEYRGARFHLFPYMRGTVYTLYRSWLPGFRRIFNAVRPDWVHGWGVESGFGSSACILTPARSIVEIQGILAEYYPHLKKSVPLWFGMLNERLTLRRARRLLAESGYSAREAGKYAKAGVQVIPHPLRDDFITAPPGEHAEKTVVFLGALDERKGVKEAILAFSKAAPEEWKLFCIGRGAAAYEQEVKELIAELGMDSRVELHGTLRADEIIRLFQNSPVFLLPTYMDTGPTALKEALAMGLWPVCYDNSGPKELIGQYQYGSLSPTGDVPALTESLRKVLTEEPWKDLGRMTRCVEQVRHDLSRETIWRQLIECYTEEFWEDVAEAARFRQRRICQRQKNR